MNRWLASPVLLTVMGSTVAGSSSGCVSSEMYDSLENEQRFAFELTLDNRQMKHRINELESNLSALRVKLARTDNDWKQDRDELLRMKIEKEQRTLGGGDRRSHSNKVDNGPKSEGKAEIIRETKELLRQLQQVLEHASGKGH